MNRRSARSRDRWLPEAPVASRFDSPTPRLPQRAFVVHLRDGVPSGAAQGAVAGRVEHVVSGRSVEFASLAELSRFMKRMAGGDEPHAAVSGRQETP